MFIIKVYERIGTGDYRAFCCKSYRVENMPPGYMPPGLISTATASHTITYIHLDEAFREETERPIKTVIVDAGNKAYIENMNGKTIDTIHSQPVQIPAQN